MNRWAQRPAPEPSGPHEPPPDVTERLLGLGVGALRAGRIGNGKIMCGHRANCCLTRAGHHPVDFSLLSRKGEAASRCSPRSPPALAFQKTSPSGCLLACKLNAGWLRFRVCPLSKKQHACGLTNLECLLNTYSGLDSGQPPGRQSKIKGTDRGRWPYRTAWWRRDPA